MTIGECIRQTRVDKNLSQTELGRRTGIYREYISRIETNDLPNPTVETIKKITDALGISLSEIFVRVERG